MSTATDAIDAAVKELVRARALISKVQPTQVRRGEDRDVLKSTAYAWFNTHRPSVAAHPTAVDLSDINQHYTTLMTLTDRMAVKTKYIATIKHAKNALVQARTGLLTALQTSSNGDTDDLAPDFSALAGNEEMRVVLVRRWKECCKCVNAEAHLAAIVMMGGLLEALFVARAIKLTDKGPLLRATSAPKDKHTGKTLDLQKWMLDSYIKVGHELNWITDSAKQFADVLKEYRNYVHPEKELRHRVKLANNDSAMFWQVTKGLARQLLVSAAQA